MPIFFWVKTMMNTDKVVRLMTMVWWTTYYALGGKCRTLLIVFYQQKVNENETIK